MPACRAISTRCIHDEIQATAAGQPSVFGHGMFDGLPGSAITDYVGIGNIRQYQVRFAKQTWPGEELRTKVVVTTTRTDGDDHLVDLDVRLHNADGEEKVVESGHRRRPFPALIDRSPAVLVGGRFPTGLSPGLRRAGSATDHS